MSLFYKTKLALICATFLALSYPVQGQFTCATATTITDGACLTGQTMGGGFNGGFAGCNGGSRPVRYYRFTAPANGDCVDFQIANPSANGTWEIMIYNAGCTAYQSGTGGCVENVIAGQSFNVSGISATGTNMLTPGTQYTLILSGSVSNTFDICFNSPSGELPSNECSSPLNLGLQTTFYNGGDCNYSGSYDDATTTDPAAAQLCAGSLENTQWISFTASSSNNIILTGSNISCTGGGCGFQFGMYSVGVGGNCCTGRVHLGCYGNKVCSGGQSTAGPTNPAGRVVWSGTSTTGFTATITGVTSGERFCFVMDGNADADCHFNLTATGILPIDLSYLRATVTEDHVNLKWETISEINAERFEVEKSVDGIVFESIGRVPAQNSGLVKSQYSYIDRDGFGESLFYRIKMVDFDGQFKYSSVVEAANPAERTSLSYFNGELRIQVEEGQADLSGGMMLRVYTLDGQILRETFMETGTTAYNVPVSGMGSGVYLASLSGGDFRKTVKFVVP